MIGEKSHKKKPGGGNAMPKAWTIVAPIPFSNRLLR